MEGILLDDIEPVGPLEAARENLEIFADSLILQDSLRKLVDWMLVLKDILKNENEISELEREQTIAEIRMMEEAWCSMADDLYNKGISG